MRTIEFIVKIWATGVALFLAYFILAHFINNGMTAFEFKTENELLQFIGFPLIVFLGYALIFFRSNIGSVVALLGFFILFYQDVGLIMNPLFVFGLFPPCVLLILIHFIKHRQPR